MLAAPTANNSRKMFRNSTDLAKRNAPRYQGPRMYPSPNSSNSSPVSYHHARCVTISAGARQQNTQCRTDNEESHSNFKDDSFKLVQKRKYPKSRDTSTACKVNRKSVVTVQEVSLSVVASQGIQGPHQTTSKKPEKHDDEDAMKLRVIAEAPRFLASEILVTRYRIIGLLGFGGFGAVLRCRCKKTDRHVAIKCIYKSRTSLKGTKKTLDEISVLRSLKHPNIISYIESWESENAFYLVTEFHGTNWAMDTKRYTEQTVSCIVGRRKHRLTLWTGSTGSLFDYLELHGALDSPKSLPLFRQAARAVAYLHGNNIAHLDIKEENILLNTDCVVKLCDFGHAVEVDQPKVSLYGTTVMAAPELWTNLQHKMAGNGHLMTKFTGFAADIWALGLILYSMVHGGMPRVFERAQRGEVELRDAQLKISKSVHPQCRDLIMRMLEIDPTKRLTIREVLQHPWLE